MMYMLLISKYMYLCTIQMEVVGKYQYYSIVLHYLCRALCREVYLCHLPCTANSSNSQNSSNSPTHCFRTDTHLLEVF